MLTEDLILYDNHYDNHCTIFRILYFFKIMHQLFDLLINLLFDLLSNLDLKYNSQSVYVLTQSVILGPTGGNFEYFRRCVVSGGERVSPAPLGWH